MESLKNPSPTKVNHYHNVCDKVFLQPSKRIIFFDQHVFLKLKGQDISSLILKDPSKDMFYPYKQIFIDVEFVTLLAN